MKTAMLTIAVFTGATLFAVFLLYMKASTEFGDLPDGDRLSRIQASPQFNKETGKFQNRNPQDFQSNMPFFKLLKLYFFGPEIRVPTADLPTMTPIMSDFLKPATDASDVRIIWLGHSTVLLRIAGKTLMIDPALSKRVAPVFFLGNRFQKPPLSLEDLPKINLVLISHDHYDHLDRNSLKSIVETAGKDATYIMPLGVGARVESFGIPAGQIVELDWWESYGEKESIKITATPSQHFSGRGISDSLKTLWAGFAIETDLVKGFYSGDTGYHTHFKEIGDRFDGFDFALLESGQYNQMWQYVHLLPAEVIQAAIDLRTRQFLPMHWGMYNLSIHDWFDPIESVSTLAEKSQVSIRAPVLGELLTLKKNQLVPMGPKWWREHPDFISRQAARK
jgi:L-ascorbate metabolism protein UlaG (beta-lactamase superfamily)